VISLLVIVGVFSSFEKFRSPRIHNLAVLGSLVYSTVFPFTVSVGEARGYANASSYMDFSFTMACMTVSISTFNPSLPSVCQWATLLTTISMDWYLPAILYVTIFQAISNTAQSSFNFEEVSLISHAITHTLFYVTQSPAPLSPHELFLPALTFGMMVSISPAVPILRNIRTSANPMVVATVSYVVVVLSILLGVRPWLMAGLHQDPFLWVIDYMTSSKGYEIRLAIVIWWFAILAFGIIVPVKLFTSSSDQFDDESLNKRRKFFHGIVVLLFLPSLNLDVRLLVV
jgi:hypothetical protein